MASFVTHNEKEIKGFFGNDESKGYRWLSNFYGAKVYFSGRWFPSNENAYQFTKLNPCDYHKHYDNVVRMSAEEVRNWGQTFKAREDWPKIKYDVMASINFDKFFRSAILRERLLNTGERYLEETNNWHDNYWGNCVCIPCSISHATIGAGENNLGKILMKVRGFWK